jgi:hypothetical protein
MEHSKTTPRLPAEAFPRHTTGSRSPGKPRLLSAAAIEAAAAAPLFEERPSWQTGMLGATGVAQALAEANRGFLERVTARSAAAAGGVGLPGRVFGLAPEHAARMLRLLTPEREALAAAPFALFDLRFGDAVFWGQVLTPVAGGVADLRSTPVVTVAPGRWVRASVVLAWHLAQRGGLAAALTLGMTPAVQALWSGMPLALLEPAAAAAEGVVLARWGAHPKFWGRMLAAVERRDSAGLRAVRHLGWQLLATDGLRSTLVRRRLLREPPGARTG